ncbi:MAG: undecaprenyl/decaprenyl-phosphate alpha-N-acetylglucosaminyl 1-phosphate transferase [Deltaproteobacteria bacterium]|nr:undecaprenyl/decaprenyl-phosphate alpha-N-acetylglucosaminyl 1-phosphate transferase [Deltaproteobacteria bacterium]
MKRNNQLLLPAWYYFLGLILLGIVFFPATHHFFVHTGRRWLYILVLAFSFSAMTTPIFRIVAMRWGLVDNPSGHKIHQEPTPLLGGAAVFLGFCLPLLINGIFSLEFGAILFAAMILFGIGLLDDTLNLRAHYKLIVQIALAVALTIVGVRIILLPETTLLGITVNGLLSVIWIVGITNAMNFFDGMDGLAAGLAAIIAFFLAIVALQMDAPFVGWTAVAMMGACLGFLPYNFRPGKRALIFLGDAGSTTIGFVLASLAIYSDWADLNPVVSIFSPLLIFWILIFDMAHITLFRVIRGKTRNFKEWIEYVGHDHLHHRMARVLGGSTQSVLFIYLLSVCLGISAMLLRNAHHPSEALLLLSQAFIIVVLVSILEAVNGNKKT